ncbi:ankyrin repeat domain-containing protein [Thiotrichales bacterium 19S9-12]|nr:ankyrin repeat domain-containing protein [Thiotrichales bacterium 19S9-11]MCF6812506.1 ankyrin repeat domain-containing protein [Thiotrichales bacterium 19S9-12]
MSLADLEIKSKARILLGRIKLSNNPDLTTAISGANQNDLIAIYSEALILLIEDTSNPNAMMHTSRLFEKVHILENDILNYKDSNGNTPLHIAAMTPSLSNELQNSIIAKTHNANTLDIQNKLGQTALHLSEIHSNKEFSHILLRSNADAQIKDHKGQAAIDIAVKKNLFSTNYYLTHAINNHLSDNLNKAIYANSTSLDRRVNITDRFTKKEEKELISLLAYSAYIHAEQKQNAEAKKVLEELLQLKYGSARYVFNPNEQTQYNKTSMIHKAAELNSAETIRTFYQHRKDTDFNLQNRNGETPLLVALKKQNHDAVIALLEILLQQRINPNVKIDENLADKILVDAAKNNNIDLAHFALQRGANINTLDEGLYPITRAIQNGHLQMVQFLLKQQGVKVEVSELQTALNLSNGQTKKQILEALQPHANEILIQAAKVGNIKNAQLALEAGANPFYIDSQSTYQFTAIYYATQNNDSAIINALLFKDRRLIDTKDSAGFKPIHIAAYYGKKAALSALLSVNKDQMNALNSNGQSPLTLAIKQRHVTIVQKLAQQKDIIVGIAEFEAALSLPNGQTKQQILEALQPYANNFLINAIQKQNVQNVQLALNTGANHNGIYDQKHKASPFHLATYFNNTDIMNLLVSRDASINVVDKFGNNPIHSAASLGHINAINFLINKDSNLLNAKNQNELSPLSCSITHERIDMIGHLLSRGAKISYAEIDSALELENQHSKIQILEILAQYYPNLLLLKAIEANDLAAVKIAIKYGANVNHKGQNDITPLHLASVLGYKEVVRYLLDKNADPNVHNQIDSDTPLHTAAYHGHTEIIDLLINNKTPANLDACNNHDQLPIDVARSENQNNAVRLLLRHANELLLKASENGNEKNVQIALDAGANAIETTNTDGQNAIHLAAKNGHQAAAYFLILDNIDLLNKPNKHGQSPLMIAIINNKTEMVKFLLAQGADVNCQNENGSSPLHQAAIKGHENIVKLLLKKGANPNSTENNMKISATQLAILIQNKNILNSLLEVANINNPIALDQEGNTTLNYAMIHYDRSQKSKDIILSVLEKCDTKHINTKNNAKCSSLKYAVLYNEKDLVEALLQKGAEVDIDVLQASENSSNTIKELLKPYANQLLLDAAKNNNVERTETALKAGATIDFQDESGMTPLHHAALKGHESVVKKLLENNANPNATDKDNYTPLHTAATKNNTNIISNLINNGANLSISCIDGTPLDVANHHRQTEVAVILEFRNRLNEEFIRAVRLNRIETATDLLNRGAQINGKDSCGSTALHYAANNGFDDLINILLHNKADIHAKDQQGKTPLMQAIYANHHSSYDLLLKKGANKLDEQAVDLPANRSLSQPPILSSFNSSIASEHIDRKTVLENDAISPKKKGAFVMITAENQEEKTYAYSFDKP